MTKSKIKQEQHAFKRMQPKHEDDTNLLSHALIDTILIMAS